MQFPLCFETFGHFVIPTVLQKHLQFMLFPLDFHTLSFVSFPQNQDPFSLKMRQLAYSLMIHHLQEGVTRTHF